MRFALATPLMYGDSHPESYMVMMMHMENPSAPLPCTVTSVSAQGRWLPAGAWGGWTWRATAWRT